MEATEIALLITLLGAVLFTVQHPFLTASILILLYLYRTYGHRIPKEFLAFLPEWAQPPDHEITVPLEEKTTNKGDRPVLRKSKSQKEILADVNAESPAPEGKFNRDTKYLTFQVPGMTAYYETLVQLLGN